MPLPPPPPGFQVDSPGSGPRMVLPNLPKEPTPQNPEQRENTVLSARGQAIQNTTNAATQPATIDLRNTEAAKAKQELRSALRKEFFAQQPSKDYPTVLGAHMSALQAGQGGAGDLNLIYGLAKILDPGSVVREGELDMAQGTGSLGQQLQGYYKSVVQGGKLPPEVRTGLLNEMNNRGTILNKQYNQLRDYYSKLATDSGIDPYDVVGPHPAAPFQQLADQFKNSKFDLGQTPGAYNGSTKPLEVDVHGGPGVGKPYGPPSGLDVAKEAGNSLLNVGAGLTQGLTSLPDMLAKGAGTVMAAPLDVMGFDQTANQLRNPFQFGDQIEQLAPTPQDWNGWAARQAAKLEGGAIGLPARATNFLAENIAGKVPQFFSRSAIPQPSPFQTYQDARSLGIQPTVEAVGGPGSRTLTSLLAKSLAGSAATRAGAQRMVDQGGQALSNIGGRQGTALSREGLGEAGIGGAAKYQEVSGGAAGRLYDNAAQLAGDTRAIPTQTLQRLDAHIADLAQVPGGAEGATYLKGLRDEIANNFPDGITIQGFRGMRSALRDKFIKDGLRGSDLERRVNDVVQAVGDDISSSLASAGKQDAAAAFKRADAAWAERADTIDNVIAPIIGSKGEKTGEQVAAALVSASRIKGGQLAKFIRAMPEDQAGDIRASLIEGLGKAGAGAQDDVGGVFSFNQLLTNWNKLSDSAKNALFTGSDRSAMDKLARVGSEIKDASRYANTSNSGGVFINGLTLFTGMTDITSGGAVAAGSYGLAHAMSNPGVAGVFARMVSARTPQAVRSAAGELGAAARKYPGAAQELIGLRDSILKAANENARLGAAAASGNPGQQQEKR